MIRFRRTVLLPGEQPHSRAGQVPTRSWKTWSPLLPGEQPHSRAGQATRRVLAVLAAALAWMASELPAAAGAITLATIDAPAGWVDAPEQAPAVVLAVDANPELAAFRGATVARAWQSEPGGAVLFLSWSETTGAIDDVTDTARRVLAWVRGMPDAAALEPGDAAVVSWSQGETRGAVDARLEWEHRSYGTRTMSRLLIYQRAGQRAGEPARVGFAHAECLRRADAPATLTDACRAALDSLALTTPEAERTALTGVALAAPASDAADPGAGAPAGAGGAAGPDDGAASSDPGAGPAIGAGGEAPILYAGQSESEDEASWLEERWLLIVGALLLLIAFYFTTRGGSSDDEEGDGDSDEADDADADDDDADDDDAGDDDADDDDADDDDADDDDADDDDADDDDAGDDDADDDDDDADDDDADDDDADDDDADDDDADDDDADDDDHAGDDHADDEAHDEDEDTDDDDTARKPDKENQ